MSPCVSWECRLHDFILTVPAPRSYNSDDTEDSFFCEARQCRVIARRTLGINCKFVAEIRSLASGSRTQAGIISRSTGETAATTFKKQILEKAHVPLRPSGLRDRRLAGHWTGLRTEARRGRRFGRIGRPGPR